MEIPHIFNVVILVNFWREVLCVKQIKYNFWRENSKSFIYFMWLIEFDLEKTLIISGFRLNLASSLLEMHLVPDLVVLTVFAFGYRF